MRKISFLFIVAFCIQQAHAGDTLVTRHLLERIDALQAKESSVFPKGIFPSYRMYALNRNREKADVNIFFTGLIGFTLNQLRTSLPVSQQSIIERILTETLPVYDKFRNRKGRSTYNFWPTDTPQIFPHSGWMNHFNKSQALPDDLDDTVIMLLAQNAPDSTARKVHALMQAYTNSDGRKVRNTFRTYRNIGAYSTWFGQKMPVDFDVCVLANILSFVQLRNLSWTAADSASLSLVVKVLEEKKHLTHAPYVSPHYSRTPIILYHLARLMSIKPIPALERFRPQLVAEAKKALQETDVFMDEIILSTALLKWGIFPETKTHAGTDLQTLIEEEPFSFFIANMASMLPDPLKQWMGGAGVGKFYYDCDAYNNTLVLEYLVYHQNFNHKP